MNLDSLKFSIRTDLAVIRRDPEFADMSNPRGEILGEVYYVIAQDPRGYQSRHHESFDELDRAEYLLGRIMMSSNPIDPDHWYPIDPVYGSEAYINSGAEEDQIRRERKEDEDIAFYKATGTAF